MRTKMLALFTIFTLTMTGVLWGFPAIANASTVTTPTITSLMPERTHYRATEAITMNFTWEVPDTAIEGDTFHLTLPEELVGKGLKPFVLTHPETGVPVANAIWNEGGTEVTFTLTSYANDAQNLSGFGFITFMFSAQALETGVNADQDLVFVNDMNTIPVHLGIITDSDGDPILTSRTASKEGTWRDGDEGTSNPTDAISWNISVPADVLTGFPNGILVEDVSGEGHKIECTLPDGVIGYPISITTRNAAGDTSGVVPSERYTLNCSDNSLNVNIKSVGIDEFIEISYNTSITNQQRDSFSNSALVSGQGAEPQLVTATVTRSGAGGNGQGTTPEAPIVPAEPVTPATPEVTEPAAPTTPEVTEPVTPTIPELPVEAEEEEQLAETGFEGNPVLLGAAGSMLLLAAALTAVLKRKKRYSV